MWLGFSFSFGEISESDRTIIVVLGFSVLSLSSFSPPRTFHRLIQLSSLPRIPGCKRSQSSQNNRDFRFRLGDSFRTESTGGMTPRQAPRRLDLLSLAVQVSAMLASPSNRHYRRAISGVGPFPGVELWVQRGRRSGRRSLAITVRGDCDRSESTTRDRIGFSGSVFVEISRH